MNALFADPGAGRDRVVIIKWKERSNDEKQEGTSDGHKQEGTD